jgi:hypothetical protein
MRLSQSLTSDSFHTFAGRPKNVKEWISHAKDIDMRGVRVNDLWPASQP